MANACSVGSSTLSVVVRDQVKARAFVLFLATVMVSGACAAAAPAATSTPRPVPTITPSPAPTDTGPADAVSNAFGAALAGGMTQQLDFLACVAGGTEDLQFSTLFGGLAELALVSSGVDPDAYWSALGTSMSDFSATEVSRTEEDARVSVTFTLAIKPDAEKLRDLMRANLIKQGRPVEEGAIDDLVDRLIGRTQVDHVIESDVTVTHSGGAWTFCA
jgi:hypothetical protein